jgi:hypothetical protein
MTTERAQAYGRVMRTLADLGGASLHADEVQLVREAADELLFSRTFDDDAERTLATVYDLTDELTSNDRLLPETARRLVADIEGCGPLERDVSAAA